MKTYSPGGFVTGAGQNSRTCPVMVGKHLGELTGCVEFIFLLIVVIKETEQIKMVSRMRE